MRSGRERRKGGHAVSEDSTVPFAACSQLTPLPGGWDCGFATPIRSNSRTQYVPPDPDARGKT